MIRLAVTPFKWSLQEQVYSGLFGPSGQIVYGKKLEGTMPSANTTTDIYYNTTVASVISFDAFAIFEGPSPTARYLPIPWVRREYDVYNISIEIYNELGSDEYVQIGNGPSGAVIAGDPLVVQLTYTKE